MGLFEAIEKLCGTEELFENEAVTSVLDGIFECGHGIADALDVFAEKLGEAETALAGEDGEESCWAIDRLDPEFESSPKLRATRDAVDSIVNFCTNAEMAVNDATIKVLEMTGRMLDR